MSNTYSSKARRKARTRRRRMDNAWAGNGMVIFAWLMGAGSGVVLTLFVLQVRGIITLSL
jgi:hypothetical protein